MSIAALRSIKALLIAAVAAYGLIAATHNVLDWGGTLQAVGAATSMSTFDGGADSWQATSNPIVIWLGALFIFGSKLVAGLLCGLGAVGMFRHRHGLTAVYARPRRTALVGCAVAVFMLFTGFIVVAETWFELWQSDVMRGPVLGSAMRYAALIALIAVFVATPDE